MILLVFVSMIIYGIMRCMPASFVETKAMQLAEKPGAKSYEEWLEQLNASYGLDTGIIQGYFTWACQGGEDSSAIPGILANRCFRNFPGDLVFLCAQPCSLYSGIIIAIPAGVAAARKQYSMTDYSITVFALIGISLPAFSLRRS